MRIYTEDEVADQLKDLVDDRTLVQGQKAEVVSVNMAEMECIVKLLANDMKIEGVNLKAHIVNQDNSINPNGFILIPKVKSIVLVSLMEDTQRTRMNSADYYISMYSDIDEVQLVQNEEEILKIDNEGNVTLHQGENKGLIKIESLVEKLNALEQKVNDLITDYKGHNHQYIDTTSTTTANSITTSFESPPSIGNLTETQVTDLENDKVKH
ncbi:hypothetical protein [Microscilla marina]|uniref:Uncharacterized protein n=1 Tax=Microscilla marina ATCC 23134 TaxID=313606 RepID=A1ZLI2_MICM2|nr:hypothetical protein [Microscilla marina]EAY28736.1 hypothetical protein M23134_07834 [Microscilla marina ATCC 23134]